MNAARGPMIAGVGLVRLTRIPDSRGAVMHMLRADQPEFRGFGEIYFSAVYPGAIKAWHRHQRMVLNYAVPVGMAQIVMFDDRALSPTGGQILELFVGDLDYCLVTIPPGVWSGFKGLGTGMALVANCASLPHDPNEIDRCDPFASSIPYDWLRSA